MFTRTSLVRVVLFFGALAVALFNWGGHAVSSQGDGEGGFRSYFVADSTPRAPLSPTSPGHVDDYWVFRESRVSGYLAVADNIAFTQDYSVGLAVAVSGAEVYDKWTWSFYFPGNPPGGGVPNSTCWAQLRAAQDPGNPYDVVALVTNCTPSGSVEAYPFPGGCPCNFDRWVGPSIEAFAPESIVGAWTAIVDFTDPGGVVTPAVAAYFIYVMYTPAVVLVHGYNSDCGDLGALEQHIEQELAVTADRVQCFEVDDHNGYDSRKGVEPAARAMAGYIRDVFRPSLGMGPDEEVDLVGHSMGGLVGRYYYQFRWGEPDGPIGSISMLGAPNEGVWLARLEPYTCAAAQGLLGWVPFIGAVAGSACAAVDWLDLEDNLLKFDPDSQGVTDLEPGSQALDRLNWDFVLPSYPVHMVHAGRNGSKLGWIMHPFQPGDCIVSLDSANGPEDELGQPVFDTEDYEPLSHDRVMVGWPVQTNVCDDDTLINANEVASKLAITIKDDPLAGGSAAFAPLAPGAADPGIESALATSVVDYVLPSEAKTHPIVVPANTGDAVFALFWPGAEVDTDLTFTLRRPDGSQVLPGQADVIDDVEVTGGTLLGTLLRAFVMDVDAAEAQTWEVTVQGTTVPAQGQPYLIALMPDSDVVLSLIPPYSEPDIDLPDGTHVEADLGVPQGEPQLITVTLFDNGTATAPSSVSAVVITPAGVEEPVTLHDDGTGGDSVEGDLTYSGTFTTTAECGTYSVLGAASGNTSEGTVARQQLGSFQVQVPDDAVRDPCNPDDDEDLVTDGEELGVYLTDPLNRDTDGDGCTEGEEVGPNKALGGQRDPLNPRDFYDITNITFVIGAKDKGVSGFDLSMILQWSGAVNNGPPNSNGKDYDDDSNGNGLEDGWEIDYASINGRGTGPDGGISGFDLNQVMYESGDSCVAPP